MIRSMTGYGGAKGVVEGLNVTVELKSVNNRYLDIAVRMPRNFLFAEDAVKSTIQQHVSRGKLDVFVTIDSSQAADTVLRVNEPLLRAYIDTLNTLAVRYDLKNDMSLMSLMRFPDILSVEKAEADQDKIRAGLVALTQQALADYDQMREREGAKLRADVEEKLARIESLVTNVEAAAPRRLRPTRRVCARSSRRCSPRPILTSRASLPRLRSMPTTLPSMRRRCACAAISGNTATFWPSLSRWAASWISSRRS